MGWASYLENIVERLNSDLNQIKKDYRDIGTKKTVSTYEIEKRLHALIRVCESFVRDINAHLEIATDPELSLADEVLELREKVKILEDTQNKLSEMDEKCNRLQMDFDRANGRAGKNFAELEEMKKMYRKLEKDFASLKRSRRLH